MKSSIPIFLALALATASAHAEIVEGEQLRVVDGDTVELSGERIRLLEPDAPEISKPRCTNELALGLQASARLRKLLAGPVEIVRAGRSDRYGRTLASLVSGQGNVADILIAEQLAVPYRPGPDAYRQRAEHWCPPLN